MKRKTLASVGSILIALALIVGATMAWFTGDIGGGGGEIIVGTFEMDAVLFPDDFIATKYCDDYCCSNDCFTDDCIAAWEAWLDDLFDWEYFGGPDPGAPGCGNTPTIGPAEWDCLQGAIVSPGTDAYGYFNLVTGDPIIAGADETDPNGIGFIKNDGNLASFTKLTGVFDSAVKDNAFFNAEFVIAGTARNAGMFRTGQARLLGDGTDFYLILQPGRVIDAGYVVEFDWTVPNPPAVPEFEFSLMRTTQNVDGAIYASWPTLALASGHALYPTHTNFELLYILAPAAPTGEFRIDL